jgi:2-polyprenyl-6-methoxyphenol hydroxylase-like FAD-dependent oxidoreductase
MAEARTISQHDDRAVVIGASMGGLLAARALAEVYERITVVDRDVLPTRYDHRKGVPQSRQGHILLARGREALVNLVDRPEGLMAPGRAARVLRGALRRRVRAPAAAPSPADADPSPRAAQLT